MRFPTLTNVPEEDIQDTHVLVRADLNVPIEDGKIDTDYRIKKAMPTISRLTSCGAKVILCSHISGDELDSLQVVHEYLAQSIADITFVQSYADGEAKETTAKMQPGDVVLFENLRQYDGEKANDMRFAKDLAAYADLYVNEAFASSHRSHASIVSLPKLLPAYAGIQFSQEVEHLSKAFDPHHPFVFILGGAKFQTKIPLIRSFVDTADAVVVAGALANVLLKQHGCTVGKSLLPDADMDVADLLAKDHVHLPKDLVVEDADGNARTTEVCEIRDDEMQLDVGKDTMQLIADTLDDAAFVVWNGPLGDYERGYGKTTDRCAKLIADTDAVSLVGGGDTVAAIQNLDIQHMFSFVSTAGGAMVDFLADETLPGIEALQGK